MSGRLSVRLVLILFAGLFGCFLHARSAVALPEGVRRGEVLADVPAPTALDFTPNGLMLVGQQAEAALRGGRWTAVCGPASRPRRVLQLGARAAGGGRGPGLRGIRAQLRLPLLHFQRV